MKYEEAGKLNQGDAVKAPKLGLHCGYVKSVTVAEDGIIIDVETPPLGVVKTFKHDQLEVHSHA